MQQKQVMQQMPTANIAINKSRMKVYNKNSDMPTYYLNKGQEFQIELFNPTTNIILAKISLNNNPISQGGLVLKPGQRVFLDRYIDVAKKFKFDTYEVGNSAEVKEAIKDNGDFEVVFYKQEVVRPIIHLTQTNPWDRHGGLYGGLPNSSSVTLDSMDFNDIKTTNVSSNTLGDTTSGTLRRRIIKSKKTKSIETGRVEQGTTSKQELETVNYKFEQLSFHIVTYKMLPISQKINTVEDTKVTLYCTECGTKQKPNNKFCPNCGTRV